MPSWNIHTAHVERLLREEGAARLGVRDVNAFLFGNFLPDIYVGYMVPVPVARLRDYRETHFADGGAIPSPNYQAFWDRFVAGCGMTAADGSLHDLVLGAWAHLVCDSVYNTCVHRLHWREGWRCHPQAQAARLCALWQNL